MNAQKDYETRQKAAGERKITARLDPDEQQAIACAGGPTAVLKDRAWTMIKIAQKLEVTVNDGDVICVALRCEVEAPPSTFTVHREFGEWWCAPEDNAPTWEWLIERGGMDGLNSKEIAQILNLVVLRETGERVNFS